MSKINYHKLTLWSNVSKVFFCVEKKNGSKYQKLFFFCIYHFSVSNVASYGFLKKRLETHNLHIHALWFDIYTGDIYYFSRGQKRFVEVNEENAGRIIEEVNRFYS